MFCKSCNSKFSNNFINFSKIPKSSDFSKKNIFKSNLYNLKLASCDKCNLIQIVEPIKFNELHPKFKWIVNKEEDKHHLKLIGKISKNILFKKNSKILGLSHYDNTIINELNNKGFKKTKIINLKKDFGIKNYILRQETIQKHLNKKNSEIYKKKYGKFDVIISSKLLEHCHNLDTFFYFTKNLLNKNGIFIVDVPDCEKSLKQGNVTMIWEEHINYFVKNTLINTFNIHGFEKKYLYIYPYRQENALVGIFVLKNLSLIKIKKINLLNNYKKKLKIYKEKIHKKLMKFRKVIMFGAGHNSIMFINLFNISKYIEFIADDENNKKNMFLAKNFLKILPSKNIYNSKSKVCLLGINPSVEKKIIKKHNLFKQLNGKFFSIYTDSKNFFIK